MFEPRSLTAARRSFQDSYVTALRDADVVLVAPPFHRGRLEPEEVLDRAALAKTLEGHGVTPVMPESGQDPATTLLGVLLPGDVVVGCSSGSFSGFHHNLIDALNQGAPLD